MTFARIYTLTEWHHLFWPESGVIQSRVGKFVSDKKMIMERYAIEPNHVTASFEIHFQTPDKFKWIHKLRGMKETWDDAVVTETIYTRVKK